MKNNNKLTLKKLQQELENLKNKNKQINPITTDLKQSKIINLFKQSSMIHLWLITAVLGYARKLPFLSKLFMKSSMFHLWLITAILGYARKLPFISKITTIFSLWFGKSIADLDGPGLVFGTFGTIF